MRSKKRSSARKASMFFEPMNKDSKIFVAGHRGMVGSAISRLLRKRGYRNLVEKTHHELDLSRREAVDAFFIREKPEFVFLAAAKVGGIAANDAFRADFIQQNLAIGGNVIDACHQHEAKKLLYLGSSCIYPRDCPQPIKEENLMTGPLEDTNRAYAIAKIAGIEMCRAYNDQHDSNFICAMPTNLYGPGDKYDLGSSHVLPALIRKFHEALPDEPVAVWGKGAIRREFLHVDDLAEACLLLMEKYEGEEIVNVGCGEDLSIRELAGLIQKIIGHRGQIRWDASKPEGTPQKLLDIGRIRSLGWVRKIGLEEGIRATYEDFKSSIKATQAAK
jgi:GDP-L-fucose synthase